MRGAAVPFATSDWDVLLSRNVDDAGRVDYLAVDRAALDRVYASVAASSPATHPGLYPTREAKLAYYLNAYNVLVWVNVLSRVPKLRNVGDAKASFFVFTNFVVGGKSIDLRALEEQIRSEFHEPRVHMALNCASAGCPTLPRHAFHADVLDVQLDEEARRFVAETRNVRVGAAGIVQLSSIFDWYRSDFGGGTENVLAWIDHYRARDAQLPVASRVEYIPYDWRLNDGSLRR